MSDEVVAFFKALADANRLKIVGLLAQQPYSVEELAALLNLKASTVSHHLAKLAQVGLVSAKTESYYNVYQLDEKALQSKSRDLFSQENLAASVVDVDADAYDNKVIKRLHPQGWKPENHPRPAQKTGSHFALCGQGI